MKLAPARNDPDMRRCTCGAVPELIRRVGSRFAYAVICPACLKCTHHARTEPIAWAVWERGLALAQSRVARRPLPPAGGSVLKRKRKGGKR